MARAQLIGRTSQNKILNFTVPRGSGTPSLGDYAKCWLRARCPTAWSARCYGLPRA